MRRAKSSSRSTSPTRRSRRSLGYPAEASEDRRVVLRIAEEEAAHLGRSANRRERDGNVGRAARRRTARDEESGGWNGPLLPVWQSETPRAKKPSETAPRSSAAASISQ